MGEEVVWSYLRSKLSSILHELEGDPRSPSWIISRFRSIERRINFMSDNSGSSSIPADLLYDLIDELSECRVFALKAAASKKGFYLLRFFWFKRKMRSRLDEIEERLEAMPTTKMPNQQQQQQQHRIQQTYPVQDLSLIIGFEYEAEKIEGWLLRDEIARVGIVGRCGGGKTALAQKVFGSGVIQGEFSPRIWVCLSNLLLGSDVDPRVRVLNYILEEMGQDVGELEKGDYSVAKLVEKLQRGLMGKRYLIVLDDLWRVDDWYANVLLPQGLPKGSGGAVIATGRREDVIRATVGDHNPLLRMEPLLNDEICWSIFCDVVRRQKQVGMQNLRFIKMEQDVIENCHGLPLAANTLATIIANPKSFEFSIPARELDITWGNDSRYWRWISLLPPPELEEVAELVEVWLLEIRGRVELKKLLIRANYSAYLVFKLKEGCRGLLTAMAQVGFCSRGEKIPLSEDGSVVFIDTRKEIPREGVHGFPQPHGKEWMEIKLGDFFNNLGGGDDDKEVEAVLYEVQQPDWKSGLIVKGIHFRPN